MAHRFGGTHGLFYVIVIFLHTVFKMELYTGRKEESCAVIGIAKIQINILISGRRLLYHGVHIAYVTLAEHPFVIIHKIAVIGGFRKRIQHIVVTRRRDGISTVFFTDILCIERQYLSHSIRFPQIIQLFICIAEHIRRFLRGFYHRTADICFAFYDCFHTNSITAVSIAPDKFLDQRFFKLLVLSGTPYFQFNFPAVGRRFMCHIILDGLQCGRIGKIRFFLCHRRIGKICFSLCYSRNGF